MCMLLLIRGASESATVNTIMVMIKLGVLAMFVVIAFTAFNADHFADFAPMGVAGITDRGRARSSSPSSVSTRCPRPVTR